MNHNDILSLASGRNTYEEGRDLYIKGMVRLESAKSFWRDEIKVTAKTVEEEGHPHDVTLKINSGKIISFRCSCFSERVKSGRLCKHGVAAAFAWIELMDHKKGESDEGVGSMLESYDELRQYQVVDSYVKAQEYGGQMQLIPSFSMVDGELAIAFSLGMDRFYKVQDIAEFLDYCRKGERFNYGRFLDFYHVEASFTPESAALIWALLDIDESIWNQDAKSKTATFPCYMKGNSVLLPGEECMDTIMSLIADPLVEVDNSLSQEGYVHMTKGNPALGMSLQYVDTGRPSIGARLTLSEHAYGFMGKHHMYVITGNTLYMTDQGYLKAVGPVLSLLTKNQNTECPGVRLGEDNLPAFCFGVLPLLTPYVRLEQHLPLDLYVDKNLHTDFYFALKGKLEITLEIRHTYGKVTFNPIKGENPQIGWRDAASEKAVALLASRYFEKKYLDKGLLTTLGEEEATLILLSEGFTAFEEYGTVHLDPAILDIRVRSPKSIAFHVQASADWLDLQVNLDGLNLKELNHILRHYEETKRIYHLRDGSYVLVNQEQLGIFSELANGLGLKKEDLSQETIHLPKARAYFLKKLFETHRITYAHDQYFDSLVEKLERQSRNEITVPASFQGILREYQMAGYQWMYSLYDLGFGGILADDMGLGKTIQTIALFANNYEKFPDDLPSLVICPASLIYNWKHEIERFAPSLSVAVITGNGKLRKAMLSEGPQANIWITSYDMLRRDLELYLKLKFRFQILDEAQYIKNSSTQTARAVKRVNAVGRFALTGTPVENNLGELWSIFDFLMPGYLYSRNRFHKLFEMPLAKDPEGKVLERLSHMTGPFILRRMKKQVLTELPDKCDTNLFLPLEGEQRKLYTAFAMELKSALMKETDDSYYRNKTSILSSLTTLREICCAPEVLDEAYDGSNAKMEALMELLETCLEGNHSVLVFSQFTRVLSRIRYRLKLANIPCFMLTGHTDTAKRQELVDRFQKGERSIFLISLKAGGTGLNLTKADTVVHYDPWWNVAAQNQATDRAHRIGQTREVNVYHLIASGTIEENILVLQDAKQNLVDQVVTGHNRTLSDLSREELMNLL